MISVAEARAIVLENAPTCAVETCSLHTALGRTLCEDIVAPRDQPPFRASAMDGYALRAADTPGVLKLIGEAGAGRRCGADRADVAEWLDSHGWSSTSVTSQDEMRRLNRWVQVDNTDDKAFSTFVTARKG